MGMSIKWMYLRDGEHFENNACRESGENQHFKQFYILFPPRNARKSLLYLTPIRHHQFLLQFCWPKMIQNSRKVKQTGLLKVFIEMMTFQWLVSVGNFKANPLSMHFSIYCLMPNQMPPSLPEQHAPLIRVVVITWQSIYFSCLPINPAACPSLHFKPKWPPIMVSTLSQQSTGKTCNCKLPTVV